MYICEICGKAIQTTDSNKAITKTNKTTNEQIHICQDCFKQEHGGVDYDTYAGRKARAQIGCYGISLGIIVSLVILWQFGVWPGMIGLGVTFLIYKVASQGD